MELDFNKDKQRIAAMSDAELIAQIRDPGISATDRMLVEAEISRRGVNRRQRGAAVPAPIRRRSKLASNLISIAVIGGIVLSILAGILEDMGIDILEWLREFFSPAEG